MKTQIEACKEIDSLSYQLQVLVQAGITPENETVKLIIGKLENLQRQYFMPSPFFVGKSYTLMNGEKIIILVVKNRGTEYECIMDQHGVHRYSTRDFGRTTGTSGMDYDRFIDLSKVDMRGFEYPHWWKTVRKEEETSTRDGYEEFYHGTLTEGDKGYPIKIFERDGKTLLVEYENKLDDKRPRTMMYMGEPRDTNPTDRFWVSVDRVEFTGGSTFRKKKYKTCTNEKARD